MLNSRFLLSTDHLYIVATVIVYYVLFIRFNRQDLFIQSFIY